MLLPAPFLIAAGLAVAAALAARWKPRSGIANKASREKHKTPPEHHGLTLREFLARHLPLSHPESASAASESQEPDERKSHFWIRILNISFFPLCVTAYAASFLFDIPEVVRFLSVSGMIGYGTNWLAVTMLFHPRRRHLLLGQGLIPRQREEIVEALAEGVFRKLINEEIIKRQIERSGLVTKITQDLKKQLHTLIEKQEFREDLRLLIATTIREFVQSPERRAQIAHMAEELVDRLELEGVVGQLLNWSRPIWRESVLKDLDQWIETELPTILNKNLNLFDEQLTQLPDYLEQETDAIEQWLTSAIAYFLKQLDIKKTVLDRLRSFDEGEVEKMIKDASNNQLAHITLVGGILGVMGGLVLWNPVAIVGLAAGGVGAIVADAILTRLLLHRAVSP